jgi:capsular exopolysaccharide synthesis family protein
MSRIQDILAKADRDGTARRLQPAPGLMASPAVMAPALDGTSARDAGPFVPTPRAVTPTPAPVVERLEPRTARATLHPALVAAIAPHSGAAEQYRAIRTKLMMREETGPLRTIGITSPGQGDGKSVTAANMALTMAQELQRHVLLVDADLRDPSVHALFAIERGPGLSEVLAGEASLDEALVHLPDLRLTLLPAGAVPEYPTELLGSASMRRALDALSSRFDRILLDLPAVLPLADVSTVAPYTDGMLMVVRAGVTQRPSLDTALATFEDEKVLGVVLNEKN